MNISWLGFAKGSFLDLAKRQPIRTNNHESNYRWQQIVNGQYIKMGVNGVSMMFGLVDMVIDKWFDRCCVYPSYWQPLYAKENATSSQPNSTNEPQWSVNDYWLCILRILSADWLHSSINEVLATFICKNNRDWLPALSCKWVSTEHQRYLVLHLG